MTALELLLVALAGVGAGAINSLVGSGTLITFPTLIAFGVPPVSATMSNAIGLVAGGVSGTWGYRRELRGQGRRLRWQIPASFLGAILGCWLLMHLPETVFHAIVPVLLVIALTLVVFQPRINAWVRRRQPTTLKPVVDESPEPRNPNALNSDPPNPDSPNPDPAPPGTGAAASDTSLTRGHWFLLIAGTFVVGVYGGYFTAAQGILLMGLMGALLHDDLQRQNAAKNLLSLIVNIVAAVTYTLVAFDRIYWDAAAVIAVGSLIGGSLGARYGRRLSPTALRGVIVVVGLIGLVRLLTT